MIQKYVGSDHDASMLWMCQHPVLFVGGFVPFCKANTNNGGLNCSGEFRVEGCLLGMADRWQYSSRRNASS